MCCRSLVQSVLIYLSTVDVQQELVINWPQLSLLSLWQLALRELVESCDSDYQNNKHHTQSIGSPPGQAMGKRFPFVIKYFFVSRDL